MKAQRKRLNFSTVSLTEWIKNRILRKSRLNFWDLAVLVSVLAYGLVFSYFTVLKHDVFRTFAWDLGIFDQALYTTMHGKLLHYTMELYMIPSGSYFAAHFSPILFLILPFYAVWPSAETLLVLGSFALAFAAVPLYLATHTTFESKKIAFAFVLLYLLYPAVQGANWFDFHTQAFLPFFIFSGFYFILKKQWKLYFLSILLALMIEEHVPLLVFLMSLYFLITGAPKTIPEAIKRRELNQALISLIGMIASAIWFLLAQYIKGTFYISPEFTTRYKATSAFGVLGVETDPLLLPLYLIQNPQGAWSALMFDYPTKLFFIILLFAPLLFLPLKSKFSLIPLILLVPSLLSNYLAYYTIGAHYPLYIIPLVFIALAIALKKIHLDVRMSLLKTALMITVLFIASTSPISPASAPFGVSNGAVLWYPSIDFSATNHTESLHKLLQLIPSQASVLTQNHIFPHVSARSNAYVIPAIGRFENDTEYLRGLLDMSDYVLLDLYEWDALTAIVYDEIANRSSHGFYALGDDSLLLKKDYYREPLFSEYTENMVYAAYKDLTLSDYAKVITDSSAKSGKAVFCPKGTEGIVTFGPFTYLLPGLYEVTFSVRTGQHGDGFIGTLDVSDNFGQPILAKKDIYGFEIRSEGWNNFTLSFTSTRLRRGLEYRTFSGGSSDMYLDKVYLRRVSPFSTYDSGSETLAAGSAYSVPERTLRTDTGNKTDEGFFVHYRNHTDDVFWFGPYWSLTEGNYTVTFLLHISSSTLVPNEKVVTLQVSADAGTKTIAESNVYSSSFLDADQHSQWHGFEVKFEVRTPLKQVEFRGMEPSPNCDVYLAFILFQRVS